ncbi:MAG: cache domain-containing protein [SAR324 cluster bacterium]|nr:cache domain-containing protein [SAR324 cluster bacterium]
MKIKYKFLTAFLGLLCLTLGGSVLIEFKITENAIIANALRTMENDLRQKESQLKVFHDKAKSDLVLTVQYPVFKEYFDLPETRAGNRYEEQDGNQVIQFTEAQRALKNKLDAWIMYIQSRFPVVETCLIDRTGQEHSRLTLREIAPDDDFSSEENEAPFFEPSFNLKNEEVHIAYPYMSADYKKWVFAYTTPIILDDGSKPAFFHFEIPVAFFQEIIGHDTPERTFVLDPENRIIADSHQDISIDLNPGTTVDDEHKIEDYFPSVDSISKNSDFRNILVDMKSGKIGKGTYSENGITYYVVYQPLPTFGWSVAQIKPYEMLLEGSVSLSELKRKGMPGMDNPDSR